MLLTGGLFIKYVKCSVLGLLFSYSSITLIASHLMLFLSYMNIIQLEKHLALHVDIVRFLTPNR